MLEDISAAEELLEDFLGIGCKLILAYKFRILQNTFFEVLLAMRIINLFFLS